MHLSANDPRARLYDVVDLDSGTTIPLVTEADDDIGEYAVLVTEGADATGRPRIKMEGGMPVTRVVKGNIKLVLKSS